MRKRLMAEDEYRKRENEMGRGDSKKRKRTIHCITEVKVKQVLQADNMCLAIIRRIQSVSTLSVYLQKATNSSEIFNYLQTNGNGSIYPLPFKL